MQNHYTRIRTLQLLSIDGIVIQLKRVSFFSRRSPAFTRFILVALLIFAVLLIAVIVHPQQASRQHITGNAQTYYVSKTGNNSNGKSWQTAWNELSKINWSVIQAGDTILIDGGSTSMTYTTTLTIGKSGKQNEPITIKKSTEKGRSGKVLIFGGRSTLLPYCGQSKYTYHVVQQASGIVFGSSSWVNIDGMGWDGIAIYGFSEYGIDMTDNPHNDSIGNLEIYDNGGAFQNGGVWYPETNGHGIFLTGTALAFEYLNIHDNSADEFDTGAGSVHTITIFHSWLHVTRESPTQSGLPFDECVHQDGYQIYNGGVQSGIVIEDSVVGPGLGDGLILGQSPNSADDSATVNNVTIRNSLFLNKDNNIMGYPQVKESGWVVDHDTIFTPGTGQSVFDSLFLEGSKHIVTNSIFYGGQVYLPDGLASAAGNCQWKTIGSRETIAGQAVDPEFVTDVSSYNFYTPLATLANADYSLKPGSPCLGKGSSITSIQQLISSAK